MPNPAPKIPNRPTATDSAQYAMMEGIRSMSEQFTSSLKEIQNDLREVRRDVQDVRERMIAHESRDSTDQISELRSDIKELQQNVTILNTDKQRREGASAALRFAKDYLPGVSMLVAAIVVIMQAGGLP